ncbi:Hypothetical predicted protein [Cloeon dipterum]|uniref:C-type lectin domain-containing protein n=1 Tax=Cloeon dipterum TaxID=197152 RepID=A0A8S1C473_9INSE|nr:Hypothetical predicted protein [Cloeon dipterum]
MLNLKCLVILLALSCLGTCRNLGNDKTSRNSPRIKEFVTINGSEYYIDSDSWLTQDQSKTDCITRNSRLVTFSSREKYNDLVTYLSTRGLGWTWFWTDGLRPVSSSRWFWSNSNTEITQFLWAVNRPEAQSLSQSRCITFSFDFKGWDDDPCNIVLPHVCEKC